MTYLEWDTFSTSTQLIMPVPEQVTVGKLNEIIYTYYYIFIIIVAFEHSMR